MPSGAPVLVPAVVPMVATNWWGRSAVYETVGRVSIFTLPFASDIDGGLDRADFSLIGERHGGRLNASEDTEFARIAEVEEDVDGRTSANEGPINYFVIGS